MSREVHVLVLREARGEIPLAYSPSPTMAREVSDDNVALHGGGRHRRTGRRRRIRPSTGVELSATEPGDNELVFYVMLNSTGPRSVQKYERRVAVE
jgi:hypothetical protein